jgi:hypothetical protein
MFRAFTPQISQTEKEINENGKISLIVRNSPPHLKLPSPTVPYQRNYMVRMLIKKENTVMFRYKYVINRKNTTGITTYFRCASWSAGKGGCG